MMERQAPELIQAIRAELPAPRRILVTGASGFVGARLANALAAAGHAVTGAGRNPYRVARDSRVEFRVVDFRNSAAVDQLVDGHELVVHAAADCSPWKRAEELREINVGAVENLLEACRRHAIGRMVHVSSTAIFFSHQDRFGVEDDAPLAPRFTCGYAATKAEAEQTVVATADKQDVFIVRARAVYGPGDNGLLPRIADAMERGRLRVIGDGKNVIDLTYVDNLLYGLVLALTRGPSGGVCTITNHEPVPLWPTIHQLLESLGMLGGEGQPNQLRKAPRWLAMAVAGALEWRHRLLRLPGEPAVTRYGLGLLSRSQTFRPTAARELLGYEPLVDMTSGLRRTVDDWRAKVDGDGGAEQRIHLRVFSTGFTTARPWQIESSRRARRARSDSSPEATAIASGTANNGKLRMHAAIYLLRHPRHGLILFDTGYAPRFFDATRRFPYRLQRWMTPVSTSERVSASGMLQAHGVDPQDVRTIVISHFHGDHVAGLADFPKAEVIATTAAWRTTCYRGWSAMRRFVLPDLIPARLSERLHTLDAFHDPGWGPFPASRDLFGDGSLRLLPLPGHAEGQIGALVQTDRGAVLLAADAAWTIGTVRAALPFTFPFRLAAASRRDADRTMERLHEVAVTKPDVAILLTHCPSAAREFGLNGQLARVDAEQFGAGISGS
ncbi:MAG: NAD-dependent epimerase/dehydratase family protein [Planctomycetales bacterium]|nr:NAD-dependent epimerase/dehydratase family protein [Planctomycetales bacterium]